MNGKYEDIIHLPHHVSNKRALMTMIDRAAQFSPFAALTGYDAAIQETGRLTEGYIWLDEYSKETLNARLQRIQALQETCPEVTVICFQPDERKNGGAYVNVVGTVKKIDGHAQSMIMTDGTEIPFEYIYAIDGEILETCE